MQKNLSIVVVDTAYHALAAKSVDQAVKITGANKVLVLSDRDLYPGSKFVKIDTISDKRDYSRLMLKELGKHVETDHFMVVQYDGMPTDAENWSDDFMRYDYIGAPWPWGPANRRVGNGGFSIRSRKLAELLLDQRLVFDPPGFGDNNYMEDTHICHLYRDWLENNGITYAPLEIATKFSAEIPGGKFETYGFHGTLCLPFYLSDDYLNFYIDNMTEQLYRDSSQIRIIYGLYRAERYDHLERMMDRGCELVPEFKSLVLAQYPSESYFPDITLQDLENLLVNYP